MLNFGIFVIISIFLHVERVRGKVSIVSYGWHFWGLLRKSMLDFEILGLKRFNFLSRIRIEDLLWLPEIVMVRAIGWFKYKLTKLLIRS